MVVEVVGFDLISVRKERDNMRKSEVLRGRNGKGSKRGNGDLYVGMVEA